MAALRILESTPKPLAAALCAAAACCAPAIAQPFFSVANNGPSGLLGDVIYENSGVGFPVPIGGGPGMGLGRAGDELIGLAPVVVDLAPAAALIAQVAV